MGGTKTVFPSTFLSSSGLANNPVNRDRLPGENVQATCESAVRIQTQECTETAEGYPLWTKEKGDKRLGFL